MADGSVPYANMNTHSEPVAEGRGVKSGATQQMSQRLPLQVLLDFNYVKGIIRIEIWRGLNGAYPIPAVYFFFSVSHTHTRRHQ